MLLGRKPDSSTFSNESDGEVMYAPLQQYTHICKSLQARKCIETAAIVDAILQAYGALLKPNFEAKC